MPKFRLLFFFGTPYCIRLKEYMKSMCIAQKPPASSLSIKQSWGKVTAKEQELRRLQEELRQQGDRYTMLLDTKVLVSAIVWLRCL